MTFFQVHPSRSLIFTICLKKCGQPLGISQWFSNMQKPLQQVAAEGPVGTFKRGGYFEVFIVNIKHTDIFLEGKLVFRWTVYLKLRREQSIKIPEYFHHAMTNVTFPDIIQLSVLTHFWKVCI